jgi:hypothetical protein
MHGTIRFEDADGSLIAAATLVASASAYRQLRPANSSKVNFLVFDQG